MRRIFVIVTILAIALFAASSNPAFGQGTTLHFFPPSKYAALVLSSYAETNVDMDLAVGKELANQRRAQGFKLSVSRTVGRVNLWLKASGAPTDNLTVQIQTDSGGLPSGTVVTNGASNAVAGSTIGGSYGWVAFDFSVPPQLTAAPTQYHLVLRRSGAVDGTNYYLWGADQSSPGYADGAGSVYGGSWQATSPATDHAFQVRPAFTVDVYAKNVVTTDPCDPYSQTEACGLGAYEFEVHFNPTVIQYVSVVNGPFLTNTGRLIWSCFSRFGIHDPANGVIHYTCSTTGNPLGGWTPFGPEGSGVLSTITFVPLVAGTTPLQFQNTLLPEITGTTAVPHTAEDGSVTVGSYGSGDSDGDGCTDIEEAGDNPLLGGDRNPFDASDFYDVPVPAYRDPTPNGPRDQAVSLADVLAVLRYVGAYNNGPPNGNSMDYDSLKDGDWNGDTVVNDGDKVGLRYDRSFSWPFSGPPDGYIVLIDVMRALPQVGASCVNPP